MPKDEKEKFMFFTANCSIKYNNSQFPCECQPWFDRWSDPLAKEPDCQKCKIAIECGMVPEPDEESEEKGEI